MIIDRKILIILLLGTIIIIVSINLDNTLQYSFKKVESDPPLIGDWIISDVELRSEETLKLNGSIVIKGNGSLTLTKVKLVFQGKAQGAENGSLNITVLEGGILTINSGSEITTDDPDYLSWIKLSKNAVVTLSDSTFKNLGYNTAHPAIRIYSNSVVISNCSIETRYNSLSGVYVFNATGVQLLNNTISSNQGSGIYSQLCSNLTISNNEIRSRQYGIYLDKFQNYNLTINNNIITSEDNKAIYVYGANNSSNSEILVISNNTIEQAASKGIYVEELPRVHILNNYISNVNTIDESGGSIHLTTSDHSVISENYVYNSGDDGIVLEKVDNGIITFNVINKVNVTSNTAVGINVTECNNSSIFSNQISSIGGDGIHLLAKNEHNVTIASNVLSNINNRGIYIDRIVGGIITDNQLNNIHNHGLIVHNSSQLDIVRNSITNSQSNGIYFNNSTDFNITDCNIKGNHDAGISVFKSIDFQIKRNHISENYDGIRLYNSNRSTIYDNYIGDMNQYGLFFSDSSQNNAIHGNILLCNYYGIYFRGNDSEFNNNSILLNFYGAYLHSNSTNTFFYFNDFLRNAIQAIDFGTLNEWYLNLSFQDSYYGNYWSDYDGEDLSSPFGFGDSPYNITGNRADFYPLMNINTPLTPPIISNPSDLTFLENTSGHFISWFASTSFKPMKYEVIIDGNVVLTNTWNGSSIIFISDSLPPGTYNVTCMVYNLLGQSIKDTVIVIVQSLPKTTTTTLPTTTRPTTTLPSETLPTSTVGESPFIGLVNEMILIIISLLISLIITIVISKTRRDSSVESNH